MTYFLTGNPQYHRRDVVSRSCSGWEGVGPTRYGRQEFCVVLAWVFEAHALTRLFWGCRRFGLMRVASSLRRALFLQSYRVKPHGQLVLVS